MHRISVLLDLAVKLKFFHWRWTSVILGAAQIVGVIRDWSDSTDVNNDLQGHCNFLKPRNDHEILNEILPRLHENIFSLRSLCKAFANFAR